MGQVDIEGGTRTPDSERIIGNMPPEPSHKFREGGRLVRFPEGRDRTPEPHHGVVGIGSPMSMTAPTFQ